VAILNKIILKLNLEEAYKIRLKQLRENPELLRDISIESSKDENYNQITRNKVLIALYNDIKPDDYEIVNFIFKEENTLRKSNLIVVEYEVEVLYLSAYLLTKFDLIEDIWKFFDSKTTDFDSTIGFDTEYLLSYGVNEVINYLKNNSNPNAKKLIELISDENLNLVYNQEDIETWKRFKYEYFLVYKFPIKDEVDFSFQAKEYEHLKTLLPNWLDKKIEWTEYQNLTSIGIGRQLNLDEFLLESLINYNRKFRNSFRIDMHKKEIKMIEKRLNLNQKNDYNKSVFQKIQTWIKRNLK
jgi:hypothetical protein